MCELYEGDGESWAVHRESRQRAKKAYRCQACWRRIEPGEKYDRLFYVVDGEGTTEFACAECSLIRDGFNEAHGWIVTVPFLEEYLVECVRAEDEGVEIWRMALADLYKRQRRNQRGATT